jgi:hypothetical protein
MVRLLRWLADKVEFTQFYLISRWNRFLDSIKL